MTARHIEFMDRAEDVYAWCRDTAEGYGRNLPLLVRDFFNREVPAAAGQLDQVTQAVAASDSDRDAELAKVRDEYEQEIGRLRSRVAELERARGLHPRYAKSTFPLGHNQFTDGDHYDDPLPLEQEIARLSADDKRRP